MGLPRGKNVVIGFVFLKHPPHAFNVVPSMTPVTLGINVTEVESLVEPSMDASNTCGNLAGDKRATATRRLMIEQNAVGQVHSVCLAIVDEDPEGILLCH
jgi:hypothetical protein